MIITLIKPLSYFYNIASMPINKKYLNSSNLKLEIPKDKRFLTLKYKKKLMKLSHSQQINLMIINNSAHKLYLSNKLKYNQIVKYIMSEVNKNNQNIKFKSFKSIMNYISNRNIYYKTNV